MNPRTLRSASILGGVALAVVALLSWSQPWFVVTLTGQSSGHPDLQVAGDVSAPAVASLAVASAAAFGAIAIAGAFFRIVLAVLEAIIGGCIVLSAILALASPTGAVEAAVTKATGVAGIDSVGTLIGSNLATAWPFVALVSGVALGVLGILILLTGHRWPVAGRRYQTVKFEPADPSERNSMKDNSGDNSVSDWDELSGGADPTSR